MQMPTCGSPPSGSPAQGTRHYNLRVVAEERRQMGPLDQRAHSFEGAPNCGELLDIGQRTMGEIVERQKLH